MYIVYIYIYICVYIYKTGLYRYYLYIPVCKHFKRVFHHRDDWKELVQDSLTCRPLATARSCASRRAAPGDTLREDWHGNGLASRKAKDWDTAGIFG